NHAAWVFWTTMEKDCVEYFENAISVKSILIRSMCHLTSCSTSSHHGLRNVGHRCDWWETSMKGRKEHVKEIEKRRIGLILMFDVLLFLHHNFARAWALASEKLTSLKIGYVSSVMVTELLSPRVGPHQSMNHIRPSILPSLMSLTHLDLRDTPLIEPRITFDLTNSVYVSMAFCHVTDIGFKTILHSWSHLYRLRVSHGIHLTDLVFHDISTTSLCLTHAYCKSLGDEVVRAISTLSELKSLLLDGSDICDSGLSYLKGRVIGSSKLELQELDISNLPNLSDNGVLYLAKSGVPISALRMRQCPLISDISIMALALMRVDVDHGHGSSLRLIPYFLRLRWLGVTGNVNRDIVDALARNRPFLHMAIHAEELGIDYFLAFLCFIMLAKVMGLVAFGVQQIVHTHCFIKK
ncbi:hypothetical protein P3X46_035216, partial [Hevea brasiliensis]